MVLIEGLVVTDPIYSTTVYGSKKIDFILETRRIKDDLSYKITEGKLKVMLYDYPYKFNYGDMLILEGELYKPRLPTNPGQFDYREYLKRNKVYAILSVGQGNLVKLISQNNGNLIVKNIFILKHELKNKLYSLLSKNHAALISAMLLGEREDLPDDIKESFIRSGTMHILAISGLHVGIIALILLGFFRLLRIPIRGSFILTMFFIIFYALLTGARPSVVRATIMACILLFGKLIHREPDIYNSLGLACLIILLYNPLQLYTAGFVLSFVAVLSIAYLTPVIEGKINDFLGRFLSTSSRFIKYVVRLLSGSLAVWIGLFPIIWNFFNIISPVTIIANLIIIPLSFIILIVSMAFLVSCFIWLPLASLFKNLINIPIGFLYKAVDIFSEFRLGHFYFPDLGWCNLVTFYILLCIIVNYKRFKLSSRRFVIILLLFLNIAVWIGVFNVKDSNLIKITFLDVGDSDSSFIQFPDGENMLIDTGRSVPMNSAESIIGPFLWNQGIKNIDLLVLTHPDSDHIGGAEWIINRFNVGYVIDNGEKSTSKSYSKYMNAVAKRNITYVALKRGDSIKGYKDVEIKILHPSPWMLNSKKISRNDKSVVLLISYKEFDILFFADATYKAVEDMLDLALDVDVLKVPHHGRIESDTILLFSDAFKPEVNIISCSKKTNVKFKNNEILYDGNVYVTSINGAITLLSDGKEFKIRGFID